MPDFLSAFRDGILGNREHSGVNENEITEEYETGERMNPRVTLFPLQLWLCSVIVGFAEQKE